MNAQIHTLSDGRALCYALYGPVDGRPVLYFHGTPSSRLEPLLLNHFGGDLEGLLSVAGVRLIAVDRPGMGLSSYNPRNSFLATARDVSELCAVRHTGPLPVLC
ncbi:MAG: alpha/beta hydrolase, partial [Chitinophagaceae bacterium]